MADLQSIDTAEVDYTVASIDHSENMQKLLGRLIAVESELRAFGGKYVVIAQGVKAESLNQQE